MVEGKDEQILQFRSKIRDETIQSVIVQESVCNVNSNSKNRQLTTYRNFKCESLEKDVGIFPVSELFIKFLVLHVSVFRWISANENKATYSPRSSKRLPNDSGMFPLSEFSERFLRSVNRFILAATRRIGKLHRMQLAEIANRVGNAPS